MNFTGEEIKKAKNCKTLEEFKELAKAEGFDLSEEELKDCFSATRGGELNDDDLDRVAGGKSWKSVWERDCDAICPFCGAKVTVKVTKYTKSDDSKYEWNPNMCTCGAAIADFYDTTRNFVFAKNGERRPSR